MIMIANGIGLHKCENFIMIAIYFGIQESEGHFWSAPTTFAKCQNYDRTLESHLESDECKQTMLPYKILYSRLNNAIKIFI